MKLKKINLNLNQINKIINFKKNKNLYFGGHLVTFTSLTTAIYFLFNIKNIIDYTYLTITCVLMVTGIVYISKNKNPYNNKFNRAQRLKKILESPDGSNISSGNRLKISGIVDPPISISIKQGQFLIGGTKEQIDLSILEAKNFKKILENM